MPGGPSANLEEPATQSLISTPAPRPSWIASPHSQPILPPTDALPLRRSRNSAESARPSSADSKPGSLRLPSNSISPSTATLSAKSTQTTSSCAPERCAPASVFPTFALDPEETRALNAAYHQRIHQD